jgi:hypothetical protein
MTRSLLFAGARVSLALAVVGVVGCAAEAGPPEGDPASTESTSAADPVRPPRVLPTREIAQARAGQQQQSAEQGGFTEFARGNGINYHGGPVMLGNVGIYYIWYGNWSGNSAKTILATLPAALSGSGYEHINTTYYNAAKQHVAGTMTLDKQVNDSYSHGTSLDDNAIEAIVEHQIASGALPDDTNAVYFVLTSADVQETSGFCSQYCGWHTNYRRSSNNHDIKYSFVGNPDQCPSSCAAQTKGPNGNAGADGMASIIAHESEEAISDPDGNAWWQSSTGEENADKCAWTFGTEHTASNGAAYNFTGNGRNWLIQQNWVNASGGRCAMSF